MKRIFVIFALAATLVGCAKEDIVREAPRQAIGFGNPFVDNSTRVAIDPSYSGTKSLASFNVYGTVTGSANTINLFDGDPVTGSIGQAVWSCTEEQYWIPNCSYKFTAIADATSVAVDGYGMPTTITFNENTTAGGDLLLATATATTNADATPSQNPVAFTFNHLLSKVKFTFSKPVYNNARYSYKITGIQFTNPYKQGVYNITNETWGSQNIRTSAIDFGVGEAPITTTKLSVESNYARMLVPANYTDLGVSIAIETLLDGNSLGTQTITETLEANFEKGKAYNVVVTLGENNLITFTVEKLTGWDSETNISIP
ncbi:MAG: fimbrillin family protein [Alistipes sp.]|nr:fimbrillin family protein [Alistipes sp.]